MSLILMSSSMKGSVDGSHDGGGAPNSSCDDGSIRTVSSEFSHLSLSTQQTLSFDPLSHIPAHHTDGEFRQNAPRTAQELVAERKCTRPCCKHVAFRKIDTQSHTASLLSIAKTWDSGGNK